MRPHRWQPTRLPRPWDSPGKNTGVGCHFLLQCMKVKSESEVAQSCPTLATPWTAAHQAPPSMGFSRQKYWSGVPSPSPTQIIYSFINCQKPHEFVLKFVEYFQSNQIQFSSVAQLCPTLCDPMNRSTLGLPVHHELLEFTQTHVP